LLSFYCGQSEEWIFKHVKPTPAAECTNVQLESVTSLAFQTALTDLLGNLQATSIVPFCIPPQLTSVNDDARVLLDDSELSMPNLPVSRGCARTSGINSCDPSEIYVPMDAPRTAPGSAPGSAPENKARERGTRLDHRKIGNLMSVNHLQARTKKLRFGRSKIHAWGVCADEKIAAAEMVTPPPPLLYDSCTTVTSCFVCQVLEYRGQLIGNAVADKREKLYERQKVGHTAFLSEIGSSFFVVKVGSDYMFRIDSKVVCDATREGSLARFLNHSCDPNCYTQIISHEGKKKIIIFAKRDIEVGEELCYDYKFPIEDVKIPCYCGAAKCRRTMN
jgi:histone-lysine N-methyltransferase SETD1